MTKDNLQINHHVSVLKHLILIIHNAHVPKLFLIKNTLFEWVFGFIYCVMLLST